jgi:hypothetical protein
MNTHQIKNSIATALKNFSRGAIKDKDNAIAFFNALGYDSQKRIDGDTPTEFLAMLDENAGSKFNQTHALFNEWQTVSLLFQLTDDEMSANGDLFKSSKKIDNAIIASYLFFAITLQDKNYTRTALSKITREINKSFSMPVLVLFKHGETLTLALINRRLHKRDESKDVLEKVTLIKDIDFNQPHRAHIEILHDFSLEELRARQKIDSFIALHQAWAKVLDTSELNKRFFKEIADWYFWAVQSVTFPQEAGDDATRNPINVIRLITRLIFVWFLKERGLIPARLFDKSLLDKILYFKDTKGSTYYKAILQNLFFATLNQEMNTLDKPNNRQFRGKGKNGQRDQHYMVHNVYRYEGYFRNAKDAFDVFFANIPFLNGGLFECLDKKIKLNDKETVLRIDGFSERTDNDICVPDMLFFTETPQSVDLNAAYGTKNKKYQVQGIINIFNRYKFTLAENTPIEEEIALDPELLGKVFENLLAAYNPETGTTARKQTGSFYTPREIVNYMVDESLIAYLENQLGKDSEQDKLRTLISYNEEHHGFNENEVQQLIRAIDKIKILDPACGSGAFPMGGLHKLVYILSKLDPNNAAWKAQQIAKAREIPDSTFRDKAIEDIEQAFSRNELDYGRKLYLIQNCIFGIDIQPIAVQIAKLRFFISLLVDQKIDDSRENCGVRPLPNLETKFVAANTLIGLDKPAQATLRNPKIDAKEKELAEVRASYFTARTPKTKNKYRERDEQIRAEIGRLLSKDGFARDTTERLAKWNPYDQNASADFFDAEWMFGVRDGFDVVIGNPPYVGEKGNKEIFREIKKGSMGKFYQRKMDLFYFFFHLALDLSKIGSQVVFITTNYFPTATGAEKLRKDLKKRATIRNILNFNELKIFESALGQHNMITILSKGYNENVIAENCVTQRVGFANAKIIEDILFGHDEVTKYYKIIQKNLYEENDCQIRLFGNSIVNKDSLQIILGKIKTQGELLGDLCYVNQGILSGVDKITQRHINKFPHLKLIKNQGVYVINKVKYERFEKDTDILKPWFKNSDIHKYYTNLNTDEYLIYATRDLEIEKYSFVYHHLLKYEKVIKARSQDRGEMQAALKFGKWWVIFAARKDINFESHKIVVPQRSRHNTFGYNEVPWYASADVYYLTQKNIKLKLKYVLALLNSKIYYLWLYYKGKRKGEMLELYQKPLSQIPIKNVSIEQQQPFITLVDKILTTKRTNTTADTTALEAQIDQLVYQLYGLTDEEIKIVEEQ